MYTQQDGFLGLPTSSDGMNCIDFFGNNSPAVLKNSLKVPLFVSFKKRAPLYHWRFIIYRGRVTPLRVRDPLFMVVLIGKGRVPHQRCFQGLFFLVRPPGLSHLKWRRSWGRLP